MLYVLPSGDIRYVRAYDYETGGDLPLPEGLDRLTGDETLTTQDVGESISGAVVLGDMPMMLSARPILTSQAEGPPNGTLILARYLDAAKVAHLAESTGLALAL